MSVRDVKYDRPPKKVTAVALQDGVICSWLRLIAACWLGIHALCPASLTCSMFS